MGFIEEERRRRGAESRKAEERLKSSKTQESSYKAKEKLENEEYDKRRLESDSIEAKKFFQKSDFPRLSQELVSVFGGRTFPVGKNGVGIRWDDRVENDHKEKHPFGMVYYSVWDLVHNYIIIGCDDQGTITLTKSWGDIRLPFSKWSGSPEVQEKALEKTYHNRKHNTHTIKNDDSSNYGPGLSGIS